MADEAQTIRSINWREVFPFTNLFKAFRVAVHPSKLVLALTALLLIYFGGLLLDQVWPNKHLVHDEPQNEGFYHRDRSSARDADNPRGIFRSFFYFEVNRLNQVVYRGVFGLDGENIYLGVRGFVIDGPTWLATKHPIYFTLFAIWFLLIWSVFGGAIARIAAVHVARDEKISVRQALRFSMNKLLSFAFAPLIPVLILLVIGAVVAVGGLLLYIPVIGPIVLSIVFFLALVAGLVMALVLLGLVGGFNLMYPTIAVEGSDSFDAISRSFSYVFARPWRMLFYTLVAIVYGALTYTFVRFFIWIVLFLTHYFVGWWLTGQPNAHWTGEGPDNTRVAAIWPLPQMESLPYNVQTDGLKWSEDIAAGMIAFWVYLVIGLLGAYAISFYFSANTIIYYLMRREVDATELEDVYVEETEDEFGETAPIGAPTPSGAPVAVAATTVSTTTVAAVPSNEPPPGGAVPAPAEPTTSGPGGGVSETSGSADPGGTGDAKPYNAPETDAPKATDTGPNPGM